jgi:hypothetical protein
MLNMIYLQYHAWSCRRNYDILVCFILDNKGVFGVGSR